MSGSVVNTVRLPDPPEDYDQSFFQKFNNIIGKWMVQLQSPSNLDVGEIAIETTTATTVTVALSGGMYLVDTTAGGVTVNLPDPSTVLGREFTVKRITAGANTLTVQGVAGNIDGAATKTMATQYMSRVFKSNGTNYFIKAGWL